MSVSSVSPAPSSQYLQKMGEESYFEFLVIIWYPFSFFHLIFYFFSSLLLKALAWLSCSFLFIFLHPSPVLALGTPQKYEISSVIWPHFHIFLSIFKLCGCSCYHHFITIKDIILSVWFVNGLLLVLREHKEYPFLFFRLRCSWNLIWTMQQLLRGKRLHFAMEIVGRTTVVVSVTWTLHLLLLHVLQILLLLLLYLLQFILSFGMLVLVLSLHCPRKEM